ncbi:MAG: hypothetical protein R2854_13835 [Caldilineaceae bacterium]
MDFGVPKEIRARERRVGLTPSGVLSLVRHQHVVYVETNAGTGAGFGDASTATPAPKSSIQRPRPTAAPTWW